MEQFRALSLFQPSNLAAAIDPRRNGGRDGSLEHLFGAVLAIPHTQAARVVAVLGFDFIFVDTLHAAINPETLVAVIQTIIFASEGKTCVIVRVPSPESALLTYALDAGSSGIIFPQVDTAAEAAAAVEKVRYAYGNGTRSLSPLALVDGDSITAPPGWTPETIADRNIAVICQIESTLGVENVDAIATTPGVNSLMLGSGDLRASLGLPLRNRPGQGEDPMFYAAVAKIVAASKKYDIPLMIPTFRTNPDTVDWLRDFKMIIISVDILNLAKAHRRDLSMMKEALFGDENGQADDKSHKGQNGCNGHKGQNGHNVVNGQNGQNGQNGHSNGA